MQTDNIAGGFTLKAEIDEMVKTCETLDVLEQTLVDALSSPLIDSQVRKEELGDTLRRCELEPHEDKG